MRRSCSSRSRRSTLPMPKLDEFADTHIAQRFSTVNGVAQVQVFGSQKYAVRLFVDPERAVEAGTRARQGGERRSRARTSNLPSGVAAGTVAQLHGEVGRQAGARRRLQFADRRLQGRHADAAFRTSVAPRTASRTRRYEAGTTASARWFSRSTGSPARIRSRWSRNCATLFPEIEREMPAGASLNVLNDRSEFIRDSIHEVNFTWCCRCVLVIGVILVFLRNRPRDAGHGARSCRPR